MRLLARSAMVSTLRNIGGQRSIVIPEARPRASLRLLCCPYAGGGAYVFRAWAKRLPSWIEVLAVEPPARGTRFNEAPVGSVHELVTSVADAFEPALERPYALFGHSLGSLVAFELACELRRRRRRPPQRLFVSGRGAPTRPWRRPPIHQLPDAEFLAAIDAYNGWPDEVRQHTELVQLLLPILRADFKISETYSWSNELPLGVDVTACYGFSDEEVLAEDVDAWRELTNGDFAIEGFDGDHFFLRNREAELLDRIVDDLSTGARAMTRAAT
jgi:medium-chain acyl-[acyl-carrier-protein] hydrolase